MRSQSLAWCAASAVFLSGCGGGLQIDTDYNPQADFSAIQTYAWAQRTPSGQDDPRVYNASSPDAWVAWHGAIEGKMSYETISNNYGYGWGAYGYGRGGMAIGTTSSRTTAREWDEGTLLIDILDRAGEELVWRSVGQAKLSQSARTPAEAQARADEVAAEMLAGFPPGGAQ